MPVPSGTWMLHDGSVIGAATVMVPAFRSAVLITSGAVKRDVGGFLRGNGLE